MPPANVLVVDDDDVTRRLILQMLEQHALPATGARDGADALHHVVNRPYGVILLDVMMPNMSGIDFLDSLHVLLHDPSLRKLSTAPSVVVMTSAAEDVLPADELQRRFGTVKGVLRKPFDLTDLAVQVQRLLS